jgi:hypothetical protein
MYTLFLFFPPFLHSQLLNPGFESWTGSEPDDWFTTNHPELNPSTVNITRDTSAHEGPYAVRGEVVTAVSVIPEFPGSFELLPSVANGGDNGTYIKGFPIASRPKQLRGWWKYQPVGEVGLLGVTVYLFKGENAIALGGLSRFAVAYDSEYVQFAAPINYLTDDIPDTIYISVGITVGDPGDVFYLDDLSLSFLEVLKPASGDVVISGEVDTIRWDVASGNIDILYSLDMGSSFTPIVGGYPADSGRYFWDVPDSLLSTKALIKIVNSEDPTDEAMSEPFSIKPWQLTRIDGAGDFELFVPDEDGWSQLNSAGNAWPGSWWQQFDYILGTDPNTGAIYPALPQFLAAQPGDHPDWPLFVDVFGTQQCYVDSSGPPTTHSARALNRWVAIKGAWGGSCEGFAVSSLLAFYHPAGLVSRFPGIGSFADLYGVSFSDDARSAVNQYYTHQFGDPYRAYENQRVNTITARQTLQELKEMFAQNNVDARPLGFYNNNGSGGHAVTPYRLERRTTPAQFILRAYDSNLPGSTSQGFVIDSAANTWSDFTGLGWGTGMTGCVLGLSSGQHFTTPGLSLVPGAPPRAEPAISRNAGGLEVYNTAGAWFTAVDAGGDSVGYADSVVSRTLAGAAPIIPKTGAFHPPIGYSLPDAEYRVSMTEVPEGSAHLMFFTDSLVYAYRRSGIVPSETDLVSWAGGVGMKNPDGTGRSVDLEVVISGDGTERIFTLSGLGIAPGDSVHVGERQGSDLVTGNYGAATQYDLEVRHAFGTGTGRFFHGDVPIGAGAGHRIVPDWGDVEGGAMKILIDAGNDGSVDDSMFVDNELTSVEDRVAGEVPSEYRLRPAYPNPFNPVTTISFDLPEVAVVSLKVYNMVGEEVAVLAEGMRQPGTYRVLFDGSGLPSGVYLCRLTSGSFSAGGKMLLLK